MCQAFTCIINFYRYVKQLDDMESWLYEEGEDCTRQVYVDRLSELKVCRIIFNLLQYY